ncbi:MAG: PQQ-dependent sugar dehydrogenase [Acidimicrobiales bacterium]
MTRRSVARTAVVGLSLAALTGCTAVEQQEVDDPTATTITTIAPAPSVTTTTVPLPDLGAVAVELDEIAEVDQPTAMAVRGGDTGLYVTERTGRVRRIDVTIGRNDVPSFDLESSSVLDLRDEVVTEGQEQGLLGITFSTDGSRLYVAYTGLDGNQHLDEFTMSANRATASTQRELLVVPDFAANHNGGQLTFGPDGYLYWGMGDGGGAGDPESTGQDPADLLGSLLRIDPDVAPEPQAAGQAYAIPNGNPFAASGGAPEVWAYGLRNPWRFSFDRANGDLWIADVGQVEVEEINLLVSDGGTNAGRGANLGWSDVEGDEPFNADEAPAGAVPPLFTYGHDDGACSVTGGYVYRGTLVPGLAGAYVYADYCVGEVRAVVARDGALVDEGSLRVQVESPSSFGQDGAGELYVLSLSGPIYRLVPA